MEKIIKVSLAIILLLCLLDMPYGFYQLVRFLALVGFAYLAYSAKQSGKQTEMFVYGALALLFQPFLKVALGRELWNIVDFIVAAGLIGSFWMEKSIKDKQV